MARFGEIAGGQSPAAEREKGAYCARPVNFGAIV